MKVRLNILGAAMASVAWASALAAQTTQPERDIVKLNLHAMPVDRAALQYKLLPDITDQTPGDGAALYLLAARTGPDAKASSDLVQRATDKYREMPLDQLARSDFDKALDPFATRLKYVGLAARRENATFNFTLREEGVAALLPYLSDMRTTANLLALKVRYQIARDDWQAAAHTLQTGFAMCRQLNDHPVLVQSLIEAGMMKALLPRLREWGTRPEAPNLYWALSDLPQPFVDLRAISQCERGMFYFTFPELTHGDASRLSAEQWHAILASIYRLKATYEAKSATQPASGADISKLVATTLPRAKQSLLKEGRGGQALETMNAEQIVGLYFFREYQAVADDAWKAWELPVWESGPMLPEQSGRGAENLFLLFLPQLRFPRFVLADLDREICLSRTIEALRDYAARHDGHPPASLDDVKNLPVPADPTTGKQFPYSRQGDVAILEPVANRPLETFDLTFSK